ncbi:hypothetical protein N308_11519, partial [Struthio camelus australis]
VAGRANMEGSNSNGAMNACLVIKASYLFGNFSETSCLQPKKSDGS